MMPAAALSKISSLRDESFRIRTMPAAPTAVIIPAPKLPKKPKVMMFQDETMRALH